MFTVMFDEWQKAVNRLQVAEDRLQRYGINSDNHALHLKAVSQAIDKEMAAAKRLNDYVEGTR